MCIQTHLDKLYSISQFAQRVNVSSSTLRRWDKTGEFKAKRHKSVIDIMMNLRL
ncbi:MAG: hypothetical protein DRR19_16320 [Candidatus Parabeggiatoa sp. nov. 1]|nr:MAG: hypothetical protein DRR19_16320 [Gammaproteobacteria bacterium]